MSYNGNRLPQDQVTELVSIYAGRTYQSLKDRLEEDYPNGILQIQYTSKLDVTPEVGKILATLKSLPRRITKLKKDFKNGLTITYRSATLDNSDPVVGMIVWCDLTGDYDIPKKKGKRAIRYPLSNLAKNDIGRFGVVWSVCDDYILIVFYYLPAITLDRAAFYKFWKNGAVPYYEKVHHVVSETSITTVKYDYAENDGQNGRVKVPAFYEYLTVVSKSATHTYASNAELDRHLQKQREETDPTHHLLKQLKQDPKSRQERHRKAREAHLKLARDHLHNIVKSNFRAQYKPQLVAPKAVQTVQED